MNKKLIALATASLLSTSALADNIMLDHDNDGDFLEVSKLNLVSSPAEYILTQYLGADGIFNNGDAFSESVTFSITDFAQWDSSLFTDMLDADAAALLGAPYVAEMQLTANLSGYVSNVVPDNAQIAADLADYIASLEDDADGDNGLDEWNALTQAERDLIQANIAFNNTSFSINFDFGEVKLYTDTANGDLGTNQWMQIGQWTNVSGFGDSPANTNGKPSTDFGFAMDFDEAWFNANPAMAALWLDENGDPILDGVAPNFVAGALSTVNSSARPQRITGFGFDPQQGDQGEAFMNVLIRDDGGSMEFSAIPEPSSIAILGLGLLGLAGVRRRA